MPSFAPTEEERAVVKLLSAYGYAQHLIAKLISNRRGSTIDEKTLRGLPATGKILIRPEYQWRYGYNHQTIYRRAPGTTRFLLGAGIHDTKVAGG
jgi:hypothetical protein